MKNIVLIIVLLISSMSVTSQILKKQIPDKLVVLTFDDATASQYSVVAPLLKQYGFGATFFVCEFQPNFKDTTKYMNWRQINELDKWGFEVANHTQHHGSISKLSRLELIRELNYIEHQCDSLDIAKPVTFAYPGYDLNLAAMDVLKEKGYGFARAGGSRAYDPLKDYPLIIPSWAMSDTNKPQIMKAFDEARDGKIVVITIHGVPDREHPWVNTSPALFREYLQYLSDHHFKVISLRELEEYIDVKTALKVLVPDLTKNYKN